MTYQARKYEGRVPIPVGRPEPTVLQLDDTTHRIFTELPRGAGPIDVGFLNEMGYLRRAHVDEEHIFELPRLGRSITRAEVDRIADNAYMWVAYVFATGDALEQVWAALFVPTAQTLRVEDLQRKHDVCDDTLWGIFHRHQPVKEDAELYHKAPGRPDGDLDGPCPTPSEHFPDDPCPGHDQEIEVCDECGYMYGDESVVFRAWPCPTYLAVSAALEVLGTPDPAATVPPE